METTEIGSSKEQQLLITARNVTTEIVEVSKNLVRIKSNCAGRIEGSLYSGRYYDTVEATLMPDGTVTLKIRYIHFTDKGEAVWGYGTGTRGVTDGNGIATLEAEGIGWTHQQRLSRLNGKNWTVDGKYDTIRESFEVVHKFMQHPRSYSTGGTSP